MLRCFFPTVTTERLTVARYCLIRLANHHTRLTQLAPMTEPPHQPPANPNPASPSRHMTSH
ncbi:hypothetical protein E2C01_011619 [Portunus trituberculatus]|uniref:Uncharacterized protein n=1 Tax=Portunus trituberculatus TaxID=210409 RepID=A0A5B7DCC5_PORTR|nr:hypothetical protein [Portunus trituberculatus]